MAEVRCQSTVTKFNQVCRFYLEGSCTRKENCRYLHDATKKNVCRYYQMGRCKYGAECRYDHVKLGQTEKPSGVNEPPSAGCSQ